MKIIPLMNPGMVTADLRLIDNLLDSFRLTGQPPKAYFFRIVSEAARTIAAISDDASVVAELETIQAVLPQLSNKAFSLLINDRYQMSEHRNEASALEASLNSVQLVLTKHLHNHA